MGGQAVSLFGDYIAFFSLPYFMLALTGDALDLGLTAAAETLPMLLFGLAAGVFLDRRRRLGTTLIGVDLVRAIAFLLLAVASLSDWASPVIVFLVAFVVGSMAVLFDSGLQSWMTRSLLEDDLVSANSNLGLARTLTLSIGPLAGGFIVAFSGGFAVAFGLNALTFLVSALFLAFVRPIHSASPRDREPFGDALRSGVRVLFGDSRLKWATLGGTLTNFVFQPLEALLVLFVATEVALMGNWFAVVPAGVAITGVTWVNVALVTMRQRLAPPEQMGRVIAASRTFAWAGLPAGAAIGGVLAGSFGVVPVYLAGSASVVVVAAGLTRTALFRSRVMGRSAS